ncbi:MAG: hypothetical protein LBV12_07560, partial [Puniceicoccales bacterium]|nr:hypothetical protein [Puniceicoccales bacterium]
MFRFAPCLLVLCAVLLGSGEALAQNASSKRPTYGGYRISVSTSSGHKQEVLVTDEEKARMWEATRKGEEYVPGQQSVVSNSSFKNIEAYSTESAVPRQNNAEAKADAPTQESELQLNDGRKLPFSLSGKSVTTSGGVQEEPRKMVDENVDPHSALRRFSTREQNLSDRRYEKENW